MRYNIQGDNLPVVICTLEQGEQMLTEKGAMSWMTPNISMETSMHGGLGKAFGRAFSGESMFMNIYSCTAGEGMIAFASSFPGRILPISVTPSYSIVVQKTAFLAAEMGVELHTHFTKKLGAGFFGGEGFIMQRLSGQGTAFLEIGRPCSRIRLAARPVPPHRYRPARRHDRYGPADSGGGQRRQKHGAWGRRALQHPCHGTGARLDSDHALLPSGRHAVSRQTLTRPGHPFCALSARGGRHRERLDYYEKTTDSHYYGRFRDQFRHLRQRHQGGQNPQPHPAV